MQLLKATLQSAGVLVREAESFKLLFRTLHNIGGFKNREEFDEWAAAAGYTVNGNSAKNHEGETLSEMLSPFGIDLMYEVDLKGPEEITGFTVFKYKNQYVAAAWDSKRENSIHATIFNKIL